MLPLLRIIRWTLTVAAVAAGGWYGRLVPFSEQWPMYEALRTTAAIIFAVIGAWMAIIYPDRLKLSLREVHNSRDLHSSGNGGIGRLFTPVVNATAILSIILIVGAAAPILKRLPWPIEIEALRGASYALLVALTCWQLWTVILTLVPASEVKDHVDHENSRTRVLKELTKLSGGPPPAA